MNYGYNKQTEGYNKINPIKLAFALSKGLNIPIGNNLNDRINPYIEVDVYGGVRIRRITHLTEAKQDEIVAEADAIYDKLAGLKSTLKLRIKKKMA